MVAQPSRKFDEHREVRGDGRPPQLQIWGAHTGCPDVTSRSNLLAIELRGNQSRELIPRDVASVRRTQMGCPDVVFFVSRAPGCRAPGGSAGEQQYFSGTVGHRAPNGKALPGSMGRFYRDQSGREQNILFNPSRVNQWIQMRACNWVWDDRDSSGICETYASTSPSDSSRTHKDPPRPSQGTTLGGPCSILFPIHLRLQPTAIRGLQFNKLEVCSKSVLRVVVGWYE